MRYLSDRASAYEHPSHVLSGVRSILVLAMNYRTAEPARAVAGTGRISRYAWGAADYHDVIHQRLGQLAEWLRREVPEARVRGVVDTAPLLEREFAQLAGLGWIGKNTLLLNKYIGSWFFLAALLTDVELHYDPPHEAEHCGSCRACLDACPTNAFPAPFVLDATKCISYHTIELRGPIPANMREGIGDWLFGCDICQAVCPWNRRAPFSPEPLFQPREHSNPIDLIGLFDLNDQAFRSRFRHTPLWRSKRRGILRNAALVLGNQRATQAIEALARGLNDAEPLVRSACAWALGQFQEPRAAEALRQRLETESDPDVRHELETALPG
jgi:epoxyqueuosine reductase